MLTIRSGRPNRLPGVRTHKGVRILNRAHETNKIVGKIAHLVKSACPDFALLLDNLSLGDEIRPG
jgi:hypothetical protein